MTQGGGTVQIVGSVIVSDSVFNNVKNGILTTFSSNSTPVAGGTLVVDNCDFKTASTAISNPNGTVIVPGGAVVQSYIQGRAYAAYEAAENFGNQTCYVAQANSSRIQQFILPPPKPLALLDENGKVVERSRPQYENVPLSSFISVRAHGATGDGATDDTRAIQTIFNNAGPTDVVYFGHGAYVISDTIQVPINIRITGECWPLIMALGTAFPDLNNPKPIFRVGNPGDVGSVEMSDLIFETLGPAPGAIIVE